MKKLILILFLNVFILSLFAQDFEYRIGKVDKNGTTLTFNKNATFDALSKNLFESSQIKETFTAVDLFKINDEFYTLVFHGLNHKTSFAVKNINGELVAKVKVSCTTTGKKCTIDGHACRPTDDVGSCACTACPDDETCTKTCSSSSLLQ